MQTFPSPAEEELLDTLSLDDYLLPRKSASFLIRIDSNTMASVGILPKDLAIFERGRQPRNGDIVIVDIDNRWVIRTYQNWGGRIKLSAGNCVETIDSVSTVNIVGVITSVIRKYH